MTDELGVAEKRGCAMVVAVQECYTGQLFAVLRIGSILLTQRLFLQNQKHGVQEFKVFG